MFAIHESCPECGLVYQPEAGYFLGAMYFSYGLGLAAAAPLVVALWLNGVDANRIVGAVAMELGILSPWLFRYSRVLWLYLDQAVSGR